MIYDNQVFNVKFSDTQIYKYPYRSFTDKALYLINKCFTFTFLALLYVSHSIVNQLIFFSTISNFHKDSWPDIWTYILNAVRCFLPTSNTFQDIKRKSVDSLEIIKQNSGVSSFWSNYHLENNFCYRFLIWDRRPQYRKSVSTCEEFSFSRHRSLYL